MDKKTLKFFAKHWLAIWFIIVSILFVVVLKAFAEYGEENRKIKRVIAPAAKTESLFTSNYLALGTTNIKSAFFENLPYTYDVIIRNYNPADPGTVFDGEIPYTLDVKLVHKNGTLYNTTNDAEALAAMIDNNPDDGQDTSKYITISCGTDTMRLDGTHLTDANSESHTLNGSGVAGENTWRVTYTNIDLDSDYCVKFTATPAAATNLDPLSATILVSLYPTVHLEGWECALVESGAIADYDAFNYIISGTGTKDLKFSYDSSKLTVNPAFYSLDKNNDIANPGEYSGTGSHAGDSNWKTIVISANPNTTKVNRYDLQVYKVNPYQPSSITEITPNAENSYIEFIYE